MVVTHPILLGRVTRLLCISMLSWLSDRYILKSDYAQNLSVDKVMVLFLCPRII